MDTIIAAIIGVTVPTFFGLAAWLINRLVLTPLSDLQKTVGKMNEQLAVRDHLLTQLVLRVEHLEEVNPHPRRHRTGEDEGRRGRLL